MIIPFSLSRCATAAVVGVGVVAVWVPLFIHLTCSCLHEPMVNRTFFIHMVANFFFVSFNVSSRSGKPFVAHLFLLMNLAIFPHTHTHTLYTPKWHNAMHSLLSSMHFATSSIAPHSYRERIRKTKRKKVDTEKRNIRKTTPTKNRVHKILNLYLLIFHNHW